MNSISRRMVLLFALVTVACSFLLISCGGGGWQAAPSSQLGDNGGSGGTGTGGDTGGESHNFNIGAASGWVDTGLYVSAGQTLSISAGGQVVSGGTSGITPNGITHWADGGEAIPGSAMLTTNALVMSLVGRIGSGSVLGIGSSKSWTAANSGYLYLGANDDRFDDNYGSWSVTVTIGGSGGSGGTGGETSDGAAGENPGPVGDPSFTLVWSWEDSADEQGPDIDLWVRDPLGSMLSSSRSGYALGPTPEGGRIDVDDQGQTDSYPGDGGGPERAYWPDGAAPAGTYTYGVRYFAGSGTAHYTLNVYRNGSLVRSVSGTLTSTGSNIELGSIDV